MEICHALRDALVLVLTFVLIEKFQIFATLAGENAVENSIIVMEFVGLSSLQNLIEEHPHLLTSSFIHRFN